MPPWRLHTVGFVKRLSSHKREFLVIVLSFLAMLILLFWRVVFLGEVLTPSDLIYMHDPMWRGVAPPDFAFASNPVLSDLVFQWYPWLVFNSESLREGIIPLWNPFVLGGTPYLANQQSAILYPLNLLLYFLPMPTGIGYLAIIRLLVAGISTYYYLRTVGVGKAGAFTGACAFTFGGFSIAWLGYSMSSVAVLLPLALLLTERWLKYRKRLDFVGLALVMGSQFLGGHPETSFHFGLIWASYVSFRLVLLLRHRMRVRQVVQLFLAMCASFALGIAISTAQVLPFLTILSETATFAARRGGPGGNLLFFPGFWKDVVTSITIIFPNALGSATVPYAASWSPFANLNEQAAYVGTVPLVLAVLGATMWRRNPFVAFWLGAAIVSAGVAYHLPGFEIVNHLPVFGIAANGRLRLAMTIGAAVLCAFGTDLLIEKVDDVKFTGRIRRWLAILTLLGLVGSLSAFASLVVFRDWFLGYARQYVIANVHGKPGFPESLEYYLGKLPLMYDALVQFYSPLAVRMYLPVIFAAGLWAALWMLGGRHADRTGLKASIVLLTAIELGALAYGYNPSVQAQHVFPETEAIAFLRERVGSARIAGIGFALTPNASMLWRLQDVRGYENTVSHRFQTFYDSLADKMPFGAYNLLAKPSPRLFDLLGVKYIVAEAGAVDPRLDYPVVFAADGIQIHENRNALPRAFLVGRGRSLPDEMMLQRVGSPAFNPREEVLLDSTAPVYEPTLVAGEAEVRDPNVNEVNVLVSADSPSWLVLSDTYADGWKAFLDGRETRIYRANYVMRAVRVDAGEHLVRFRYDPPAFAIGLRVSIAALILTGAIAFYPLIRRARVLRPSAVQPMG